MRVRRAGFCLLFIGTILIVQDDSESLVDSMLFNQPVDFVSSILRNLSKRVQFLDESPRRFSVLLTPSPHTGIDRLRAISSIFSSLLDYRVGEGDTKRLVHRSEYRLTRAGLVSEELTEALPQDLNSPEVGGDRLEGVPERSPGDSMGEGETRDASTCPVCDSSVREYHKVLDGWECQECHAVYRNVYRSPLMLNLEEQKVVVEFND